MSAVAPAAPVGELLRTWRQRRHRSQLDLATEAEVSTRHLSFVETGRARPSRELLLHLAEHLDVPLRERNVLLLAAGYAPVHRETPLDDVAMGPVRAALDRLLEAHRPFPALIVNRRHELVLANPAAVSFAKTGTASDGNAAFDAKRGVYNVVRGADVSKAFVANLFSESGYFCSSAAKAAIAAGGLSQLATGSAGGVCGQQYATTTGVTNFTLS